MLPTGQGGGASHQRGNAGVVHEVYNSLFFSSNSLFPLEGKCHVVAKGCTGQSNDVILYRYPDRQSAASLATSWSSPPCKQVALVLISAVVKVFHKRAPSINVRRPPPPSAAEPLSNLRTLGAIAPSNFRTLTPAGCQSSCWWEQGFPLSHIPRKKAKHDASPFYFLSFHPFPSILPYYLFSFLISMLPCCFTDMSAY